MVAHPSILHALGVSHHIKDMFADLKDQATYNHHKAAHAERQNQFRKLMVHDSFRQHVGSISIPTWCRVISALTPKILHCHVHSLTVMLHTNALLAVAPQKTPIAASKAPSHIKQAPTAIWLNSNYYNWLLLLYTVKLGQLTCKLTIAIFGPTALYKGSDSIHSSITKTRRDLIAQLHPQLWIRFHLELHPFSMASRLRLSWYLPFFCCLR